MYWLPSPVIDPQLPLSGAQRREVTRAAWSRWLRNPVHSVLNSAGLGVALLAFLFLPDLIEPLFGAHRWYFTLIWFALYIAAVGGLILLFRKIGYAPCVYAELRARGFDVCYRCGYLLAGLPQERDRCPECGVRRRALDA